LIGVAAAAVALATVVWAETDGGTSRDASTAVASPAPSPPAWLLAEAHGLMPASGDGHLDAAYWGAPHDPELGDLTSSGPDDPTTWAYVLVFTGDFPEDKHTRPMSADATPGPAERMRWRLYVFDDVTHELGGYGEGPGAFDAAAYPSLRPFEL
jgi:hypothetical protein